MYIHIAFGTGEEENKNSLAWIIMQLYGIKDAYGKEIITCP